MFSTIRPITRGFLTFLLRLVVKRPRWSPWAFDLKKVFCQGGVGVTVEVKVGSRWGIGWWLFVCGFRRRKTKRDQKGVCGVVKFGRVKMARVEV